MSRLKLKKTLVKEWQKKKNKAYFAAPEFVRQINEQVVEGVIKKVIASGRSPVKGYGRFDGYLNPDKYPGEYLKARGKAVRPVNLFLNGEMLKDFKAASNERYSLAIGIHVGDSAKLSRDKARTHNFGLNGVPMRRFIPQDGESFVITATRIIKNLFTDRLKKLLSL